MKLLSISKFDIYFNGLGDFDISKRIDIFELKFVINENITLFFPFFKKSLKNYLIPNFENILLGKEVCINLNMMENIDKYFQNDSLLKINNEYIEFLFQKEYSNTEYQLPTPFSFELKFENNNIFRNGLREFLCQVKKIIISEKYRDYEDIIENYHYYHGVYFPRKDLIPSKDQTNFLDINKLYIKEIISSERDLSIKEYQEKFSVKNNLGIYIYDIFNNTNNLSFENLQNTFEKIRKSEKVENKEDYSNYWEYYGVLVPNKIDRVPSYDQENTHYKSGKQSQLKSFLPELTIEEYREKFAYKNKDGKYIFKLPGQNIENPNFKNLNEWAESTWYGNKIRLENIFQTNKEEDILNEDYSDDFESDSEDEKVEDEKENKNYYNISSSSDNYSEASEISTISFSETLKNFDENSFEELEKLITKELRNAELENIFTLSLENFQKNLKLYEDYNRCFYISKGIMKCGSNDYHKYFNTNCKLSNYFFIGLEGIDIDLIHNIKIKLADNLEAENLSVLLESSDFEIYYIHNNEKQKLHYNFGNTIIPLFLSRKNNSIFVIKIFKYEEIDYFELYYNGYNITKNDKENLLKNILEYQDKNNKFIFLNDGNIVDNNR